MTVPHLMASPRHGGARQFQNFSVMETAAGAPCFGATAIIAMENDDPSLIISYYPDSEGEIFTCSRILSEFRITGRSGSVEILIETNNRS